MWGYTSRNYDSVLNHTAQNKLHGEEVNMEKTEKKLGKWLPGTLAAGAHTCRVHRLWQHHVVM